MFEIAGVGAANIDIQGYTEVPFLFHDSNPGIIKQSVGGVTRNALEVATSLGAKTSIVTSLSKDIRSEPILQNLKENGIDYSHAKYIETTTPAYLALLDEKGEMVAAISDMHAHEKIGKKEIQGARELLEEVSFILCDTCVSQEALEELAKLYSDKLVLDPVSIGKAAKVKNLLQNFHAIKCNHLEGEYFTKTDDIEQMVGYFTKQGIQEIIITSAEKGVFFLDERGCIQHIVSNPLRVKSATGAGDSFMGAYLYYRVKKATYREAAIYAMAAARLSLGFEGTIYPNIKQEIIEKEIIHGNIHCL